MDASTPAPTLLTVPEVAARLGVSERLVRQWIADGTLAAVRVGPKLVRVAPDALAAVVRPMAVAG